MGGSRDLFFEAVLSRSALSRREQMPESRWRDFPRQRESFIL